MFFGSPVRIAKLFFVFSIGFLCAFSDVDAQINPDFDIRALQKKTVLSLDLGHDLSENSPLFTEILEPFARRLEAVTEEKLAIMMRQYPPIPDHLVKNLDQAVRDGDIAFAHIPLFSSLSFRHSALIALPYRNASPEARAKVLWEMARGSLASEYKGLKLLSIHIDMEFFLHSGERPELSLVSNLSQPLLGAESLAEKNIYTPNQVMQELTQFFSGRVRKIGTATPQTLQRDYIAGAIDGFGAADALVDLPELQKDLTWHYHFPNIGEPYVFAMNAQIFKVLPKSWQDFIVRASQERMIEEAAYVLGRRTKEDRWRALGHNVLRPEGEAAKAWNRDRQNFMVWLLRRYDERGFSTASLYHNEFSLKLDGPRF